MKTAGSVINAGIVTAYGDGVYLADGGRVTNAMTGTIISSEPAVNISGTATAHMLNQGYVLSMLHSGIYFRAPGSVTNAGQVVADHGGIVLVDGGSIDNIGMVTGGFYGVLSGIGTVSIAAAGPLTLDNSAPIEAIKGPGIKIGLGGAAITTSGTIEAATGFDAVQFNDVAANTLIVEPSAVFVGNVDGGSSVGAAAISVLERVDSVCGFSRRARQPVY